MKKTNEHRLVGHINNRALFFHVREKKVFLGNNNVQTVEDYKFQSFVYPFTFLFTCVMNYLAGYQFQHILLALGFMGVVFFLLIISINSLFKDKYLGSDIEELGTDDELIFKDYLIHEKSNLQLIFAAMVFFMALFINYLIDYLHEHLFNSFLMTTISFGLLYVMLFKANVYSRIKMYRYFSD